MWFFKKKQLTLWERLERALHSGDTQAFVEICANEAEAINDAYPGWQTLPGQLGPDEQQRYIHVLVTVARVFAEVFGEPHLMDRLTGGADNPIQRWNDALQQASRAIPMGGHEQAEALLVTVLAEMQEVSGSAVDHMLGMVYGRLGECRTAAGDADGALEYFDQALEHCRTHGDAEGVLTYLGNRAFLLEGQGRQSEAAASLRMLATVLSAADGSRLAPATASHHALLGAGLALKTGDVDLALRLCREGADGVDRVPDDVAHPLSVEMNNVAESLRHAGRFDEARALLDAAIEFRRRHIGEDFVLARFLGNRGYLGVDAREEDRAHVEAVLMEALQILERIPDADRAVIAEVLNNLGAFHQAWGDAERARHYYRRCLELKKTYLPREDPAFGTTYKNLAFLEVEQHNDTGAKVALEALREIRPGAADRLDSVTRAEWANLCDIYLRMGNFADAEGLAVALLEDGIREGEDSLAHASGLVKLADVRSDQRRNEEAGRLYAEAIRILRKHPEEKESLSAALNNLGLLWSNAGQYERALELLRESLAIKEAVLGRVHPDWASTANNLAIAESSAGETGRTRALLTEILEVRRRTLPAGHPLIAQSLYNLGYYHVERTELEEGLRYVEEWADAVVAARVDVLAVASEMERLAYLRQVRGEFDTLTQVTFSKAEQHSGAAAVLFDVVLKMKGMALDALLAQHARLREHGGEEFERAVAELREVREWIAHAMLTGQGGGEPGPELRKALSARRRLEASLAAALPTGEFTDLIRSADRHGVAAALPPDAALLEFFRFELSAAGVDQRRPAYLLFVLPAGEPDNVGMVVLGLAEKVEYAVETIRNAIIEADGPGPARDEMIRVGTIVTNHILGHAARQLDSRRRLFVAADGAFNQLPLELLPMASGGVLGERFEVSYVNTGRDLLSAPAPAATGDPVVIGDPDFDLGSAHPAADEHRSFEPLAGTAVESARIAGLLGVEPWVGADAVEARVKAVHSPWILHIATHGFSASLNGPDAERVLEAAARRRRAPIGALELESLDNPLLASGLALAGANTWLAGGTPPPEAEDGLLLGEDVLSLNLHGTELVVLSACETGLGRYEPGEGIYGLRRAFLLAGARSLVVSLWSVPDAATQQLMVAFYEGLLAGESRIGALRRAQQMMRVRYADPYYLGGLRPDRRCRAVAATRPVRKGLIPNREGQEAAI